MKKSDLEPALAVSIEMVTSDKARWETAQQEFIRLTADEHYSKEAAARLALEKASVGLKAKKLALAIDKAEDYFLDLDEEEQVPEPAPLPESEPQESLLVPTVDVAREKSPRHLKVAEIIFGLFGFFIGLLLGGGIFLLLELLLANNTYLLLRIILAVVYSIALGVALGSFGIWIARKGDPDVENDPPSLASADEELRSLGIIPEATDPKEAR